MITEPSEQEKKENDKLWERLYAKQEAARKRKESGGKVSEPKTKKIEYYGYHQGYKVFLGKKKYPRQRGYHYTDFDKQKAIERAREEESQGGKVSYKSTNFKKPITTDAFMLKGNAFGMKGRKY